MLDDKILYVDDESPNLFLFKMSFRNELEVCTATSGQEALQVIAADQGIKMVISDMRMPHMNGIEFITKAKEIRNDIPYCLLTGFDIDDEIEIAIANKIIDHYFKKPFKKEAILRVLQ